MEGAVGIDPTGTPAVQHALYHDLSRYNATCVPGRAGCAASVSPAPTGAAPHARRLRRDRTCATAPTPPRTPRGDAYGTLNERPRPRPRPAPVRVAPRPDAGPPPARLFRLRRRTRPAPHAAPPVREPRGDAIRTAVLAACPREHVFPRDSAPETVLRPRNRRQTRFCHPNVPKTGAIGFSPPDC